MLRVSEMAKRRKFTKQFKADVVRLIKEGGKSVADVCRDHDLYDSSVYGWLRQAEVDIGDGPAGALTTAKALRQGVRPGSYRT